MRFEDRDCRAFGKALGEEDSGTDEAGDGDDGENNRSRDKVIFDERLVGAAN